MVSKFGIQMKYRKNFDLSETYIYCHNGLLIASKIEQDKKEKHKFYFTVSSPVNASTVPSIPLSELTKDYKVRLYFSMASKNAIGIGRIKYIYFDESPNRLRSDAFIYWEKISPRHMYPSGWIPINKLQFLYQGQEEFSVEV